MCRDIVVCRDCVFAFYVAFNDQQSIAVSDKFCEYQIGRILSLCLLITLSLWLKLNNFVLTASYGGLQDKLIKRHDLRTAIVVYSEDEAKRLHLEIDQADSHAANPKKRNKSFALLIHGVQPKDSEASKALQKLKG